jgi:hypothetical protein
VAVSEFEESVRRHERDGPEHGGVPDLEWAKSRIPIPDVARVLGLEICGRMIRCWRPDAHQYGDRTPSVGIQLRANRVKCFVCDARRLSTVDLVMSVEGLSIFEALLWLDARFDIPRVPRGKHLAARVTSGHPFRAGVSATPLEELIRSGLYAEMSACEIRLLDVLLVFADPETGKARLSYAGLRRYSGIKKDSTVSKGLKRLERMYSIEIIRGRGGNGLATCNGYRLTLEDSRLVARMNENQAGMREEIEVQRVLRSRARGHRVSSLAERKKGVSVGVGPAVRGVQGLKAQVGSLANELGMGHGEMTPAEFDARKRELQDQARQLAGEKSEAARVVSGVCRGKIRTAKPAHKPRARSTSPQKSITGITSLPLKGVPRNLPLPSGGSGKLQRARSALTLPPVRA